MHVFDHAGTIKDSVGLQSSDNKRLNTFIMGFIIIIANHQTKYINLTYELLTIPFF